MKLEATEDGGRIAKGSTPYGRFRVEWNAVGKLVSESIDIFMPGTRPGKTPESCQHGGEQVDTSQCSSCSGTVKIKVYACAVHGRCTIKRKVDGAPGCCVRCDGFTASQKDPASSALSAD